MFDGIQPKLHEYLQWGIMTGCNGKGLGTFVFSENIVIFMQYSKTGLKRPLKTKTKIWIQADYRLMQVKSTAECSKRAFCNTFDLHKATILSLRHLFCLFLSGCLRQVLLYLYV